MSLIRLRIAPRTFRVVDVRAHECPSLACFWMTTHTIRSAAGASGCSSRLTDDWLCGYREQRGCPERRTREEPPKYRRFRDIWEKVERGETP